MTDRATCVLIGEVVAGAAGRPTVGIAGRNVVAVQIDRRRVEFGRYFHVFLQRFEQIGDRVAPCFAAKLLQCGFQRLLARLLGDEACPFVKLRRPLCSGAVEIAPRLSEPASRRFSLPWRIIRASRPLCHRSDGGPIAATVVSTALPRS